MKKIITAILIATMITSTAFVPKRANALVAAATVNPALGFAGLYIMLSGLGSPIALPIAGGVIGGGVGLAVRAGAGRAMKARYSVTIL